MMSYHFYLGHTVWNERSVINDFSGKLSCTGQQPPLDADWTIVTIPVERGKARVSDPPSTDRTTVQTI